MNDKTILILDEAYKQWLSTIKNDYKRSQIKAATKVNAELVAFNWRLGRSIALMRAETRWGSGFFDAFSRDLRELLPESKGFSSRNLRYMERFYRLFPSKNALQNDAETGALQILPQVGEKLLPQVGAQIFTIPWNHIKCIIDKCCDDPQKALFYIQETINNNWSRAVLLNLLGTGLYERKGKAITNFPSTFPDYKGDLATEITKDPYLFDFFIHSKGIR